MSYKDLDKQRAAWRAYYYRHPEKHHQAKVAQPQQAQVWFAELKTQYACLICGENDPVCIDFHHVNEEEKLFNVGDANQGGYSRKRVLEEIGKCVALCANCHRKLHAGKINLPPAQ